MEDSLQDGKMLDFGSKITIEAVDICTEDLSLHPKQCCNPTTRKTPFEMMTGHKPNLKNMHIFGTVCYGYVQNKKKLDALCEQGIFLGYDMESPAYLIYFPEKDDVKQVRCVKFSENFECSNDDIVDVPEEYSYSRPDEDE